MPRYFWFGNLNLVFGMFFIVDGWIVVVVFLEVYWFMFVSAVEVFGLVDDECFVMFAGWVWYRVVLFELLDGYFATCMM